MVYDIPPLPAFAEPYGLLCSILQDATRDWRAELHGDLGPDVTTGRPRPGGPSIGAIMLHMIGVEVFWFEHFVLGKRNREDIQHLMWDKIDVDAGVWPDVPEQPLSWYFDLHDRYRARTLESIKEWPVADSLLDREGEENKYTPRWVLGHVIQHEAYHGGQIVMLHDFWKNGRAGSA